MKDANTKISHHAQVGGIETAVLDNGQGRGVRVAWINTGSPLRYKVVVDRSMDIADAFHSEHGLAWISRQGTVAPHPAAHQGLEWLRSFSGGLLTTCGLSHVGAPEADGSEGLHGRISNTPAELISIEQPDPEQGKTRMAITGLVRESSVFGPHLELRRTISSDLGASSIIVHDEVTNRGNTAVPHMLLYHCNLGWPLIDECARLIWRGDTRSRGLPMDDAVFGSNDFKTCPAPNEAHNGAREACAFIDPQPDDDGLCRVGACNPALNLTLTVEFNPLQLPCLTNWQHWGRGEYVTGLEPCTNFPIGRAAARESGTLIMLEPGERRNYDLAIRVTQNADANRGDG